MPRLAPQVSEGLPRMGGVVLFRLFDRLREEGLHLRFWHVAVLLAVIFLAVSVVGSKAANKD